MIMALSLAVALPASAAPLKVFIPEFKVTGAANRDELKGGLQGLLATRLSGESIVIADTEASADLSVVGAYIAFGKVFSLDANLKDRTGKIIGRAFEQGDSSDDIIPAVTRLAQKVSAQLTKAEPSPASAQPAVQKPATIPAPPALPAQVERPAPQAAAQPASDIIRPEAISRAGESGMIGQRLDGAMVALAVGKSLANGERELFMALEREIRLYRQGKGLTLLASEKGFSADDKIIGIEAADLDGDGTLELYVTRLKGEELASQVWVVENGKFKLLADGLPYFFRTLEWNGSPRLYAQQMGRDEDFFNGVSEVVRKGSGFELKNPVKLPRFGTIYNVNFMTDKEGRRLVVMLHLDGYLTVSDDKGEELWRSNDRFGGSEAYFSREDQQNVRVTGELYRKIFLEQRIVVTKGGDIIVPKNDGFWVVGNSRSFSKNSVYSFSWNGAALEERWHTKLSQNYLADYAYDESLKELVLLEVVKKPGMVEKGASAISIKRVE